MCAEKGCWEIYGKQKLKAKLKSREKVFQRSTKYFNLPNQCIYSKVCVTHLSFMSRAIPAEKKLCSGGILV